MPLLVFALKYKVLQLTCMSLLLWTTLEATWDFKNLTCPYKCISSMPNLASHSKLPSPMCRPPSNLLSFFLSSVVCVRNVPVLEWIIVPWAGPKTFKKSAKHLNPKSSDSVGNKGPQHLEQLCKAESFFQLYNGDQENLARKSTELYF